MASRDWVCTVCTAQNRLEDKACRVCATERRIAGKVEPEGKRTAEPVSPEKAHEVRKKKPEVTPDELSSRVRTLLMSLNILWGVVLVCTAVQWIAMMTIPQMIEAPSELLERLKEFSMKSFLLRLQQAGSVFWQQITSDFSLASPAEVWQAAVETAGQGFGAALSAQSLVLMGVWALRTLVYGVLETNERTVLRSPNLTYFTIMPFTLLLVVLALLYRKLSFIPLMWQLLISLFALQTAGMVLVLAAFLLIGAFSHLNMTKSIFKGAIALVLMWFFAGILCAA